VDRAAADLEVHSLHRGKAAELLGQTAGFEDDVFHVQTETPGPVAGYEATLIRGCDRGNRRNDRPASIFCGAVATGEISLRY